jgi:5S rRNA maturation endonuclease (ribonuclease M5)
VFFEEFFIQRGEAIEPNSQGEVMVKCPFPHDKGYEKHASASFNVNKRIYKCFACTAEERDKGMGETSFIARVYGTDYDSAAKLKNMQIDGSVDNLSTLVDNLLSHAEYFKYLTETRGLTRETIVKYKLGYKGDGILYPVILNGILVDERTYNPNPDEGEPKIRSRKNAKALLFPYDEWVDDERDTVLTAGENDTLLARQYGFNAVETTLGEGSIPKILLNKFKDKKVYVCYDCDEAGKKSALRMAFYLRDIGAELYIIDLGLQGTKEDKDITDYFLKHNKKPEDLQTLIEAAPLFTQEQYVEQKNKEFELVELWNVKQARYSDKYISSRVMQMGHFELPLVDIPSHIEWYCRGAVEGNKACESCRMVLGSGEWSLGHDNLGDVLDLVEVTSVQQDKNIRRLCRLPEKCPNARISVVSKKHVEKVILAPDVESESEESGYRQAELHAFVLDGDTDDGDKYRMFFKRVPHPKDQSIILIVDKVEESDNAINSFKVTPQFLESMKVWQGNPYTIMKKRYEELGKHAVGKYLPESIFFSSEIVYHSVLDFKFLGRYEKGHPEGLIVGASRTGKSEVGKVMSEFYGLGNVTECKNASVAGLIGGVDKSSNGTYRISWGEIPRNHKGMLFLDEISGMHPEVFKHLTGLRSQRVATIAKIQKGKAPAKTRLLWVGNPRTGDNGRSRSLYDYPSGVDVCLDLFPADEDVSRFDFIVLVPEPDEYISPLNDDGTLPEEVKLPDELKGLIRWVWSRNRDQVIFDKYVEKYIEHVAHDLNKDFGSNVKIIGIEGVKKIARIAVSVAACCFSCSDDGENIVVKKEHIDWVRDFLITCYDNDIFRLKQYVIQERKFITTNDAVNLQVANIAKQQPMIIKLLLEQPDCPHYNLQAASGMDRQEYNTLVSKMFESGLVQPTQKGITATRRLRLAVNVFKSNYKKKNLVPLTQEGGLL